MKKNNGYKDSLKNAKTCMLAKKFLDGRIAGVVEDRLLRANIVGGKKDSVVEMKADNEHYRVLAAYNKAGKFTGYSAVFDINKIQKGGFVTLQVSDENVKKGIIGGGKNLREWCKNLGVRRITVISPEDKLNSSEEEISSTEEVENSTEE